MKILFGIIFFHFLVLIRAKITTDEGVPIISTSILTLLLVGYVVYMMITMPQPEY